MRSSTSGPSPTTGGCASWPTKGSGSPSSAAGSSAPSWPPRWRPRAARSRCCFPRPASARGSSRSISRATSTSTTTGRASRCCAGQSVIGLVKKGRSFAVRTLSGARRGGGPGGGRPRRPAQRGAGRGGRPRDRQRHRGGRPAADRASRHLRRRATWPASTAPRSAGARARRARGQRPDDGAVRRPRDGRRRRRPLHAPAVLLLRPVRPRLRGRGRRSIRGCRR